MRRRGTIEKRAGSFRVRLQVGDRTLSDTFPTKREAERWLAELIVDHDGDRGEGRFFTVDQCIGEWYRHTRHAATTRYDYQRAEKLIPSEFLDREIGTLRGADFKRLYQTMRQRRDVDGNPDPVSEWRIVRVHEILSGALGLAWRSDWISDNPAAKAPPKRPTRRTPQPPAPADVAKIVDAVDDDLRLWLRIASTTGMRRGEVAGLQWRDLAVDENGRGVLWVRRAVAYAPGAGVHVKSTKSERERRFSIGARLAAELMAARDAQRQRAADLDSEWDEGRFVISSDPVGVSPWRPDYATDRVGKLRDSLGLEHVRLKEFRHYVVTQLLAARVDPRTVAGRVGHARTSMTTDVYAAWLPEVDRAAAEILD